MHKVLALQISDHIDIKAFKGVFTAKLLASDSDELFYQIDKKRFVQIFKYGVVCFLNHNDVEMTEFIKMISEFCRNNFEAEFREEFSIDAPASKTDFSNSKVRLTAFNPQAIRLVMLNVSESVALSYYSHQTSLVLELTNKHTFSLEQKGQLDISGKRLKKFIGRTLNLKNRITQNLYIFGSAPGTWEDESLDKIHTELKKIFDLERRYRSILEDLEIVAENLDLFKDILHHRDSSKLEWIIILLILVEVINLFFEKGWEKFIQ